MLNIRLCNTIEIVFTAWTYSESALDWALMDTPMAVSGKEEKEDSDINEAI